MEKEKTSQEKGELGERVERRGAAGGVETANWRLGEEKEIETRPREEDVIGFIMLSSAAGLRHVTGKGIRLRKAVLVWATIPFLF